MPTASSVQASSFAMHSHPPHTQDAPAAQLLQSAMSPTVRSAQQLHVPYASTCTLRTRHGFCAHQSQLSNKSCCTHCNNNLPCSDAPTSPNQPTLTHPFHPVHMTANLQVISQPSQPQCSSWTPKHMRPCTHHVQHSHALYTSENVPWRHLHVASNPF